LLLLLLLLLLGLAAQLPNAASSVLILGWAVSKIQVQVG
jgi:hypothetical protein